MSLNYRLAIRATYYPTWWYTRAMCALGVWNKWDWITPNVLLGCRPSRRDIRQLRSMDISAVINLCEEFSGSQQLLTSLGMTQLHLPTLDYHTPTSGDLLRGMAFMVEQSRVGRKVYVHCKAGRGRSAVLVVCYMMATQGITADQAEACVRESRSQVDRHLANREAVRDFERLARG